MDDVVAPAPPTARVVRRDAPARTLRVGGFVPFTTTDYPGRLAAVVFCQGCPWRCGYCHNPHLLPSGAAQPHDDWDEIVPFLARRRGLLDAVVFSGGEPTAQEGLIDAITDVRALGFDVALHTAGVHPRRLARALEHVAWVGLDIKAPASHYARVTGVPRAAAAAFESLERVAASGVPYEVRTTVHPDLIALPQLEALAVELAARGVLHWVLQPFRPIGCASAALIASAPRGTMLDRAWIEALRRHVPGASVRE